MDSKTFGRLAVAVVVAVLAGCLGGGENSGGPVSQGVFVDAEVSGLEYDSGSISGVTNSLGQFQYRRGEVVRFSLAGVELGSVTGQSVVTLHDLVGISRDASLLNRPDIVNMARLLQSLDIDQDVSNGIEIPGCARNAAAEGIQFDQNPADFGDDDGVKAILEACGQPELLGPQAASREYLATLNAIKRNNGVPNYPPVIQLEAFNSVVMEGRSVTLDASRSRDPDGQSSALRYLWEELDASGIAILSPQSSATLVSAPNVNGETRVSLRLTVKDSDGASDSIIVQLTIADGAITRLAPEAVAGPDQAVDEGVQVVLSGAASSDSDGTIVGYQWLELTDFGVLIQDAGTASPRFTAPQVSVDSVVRLQLSVRDNSGDWGRDVIEVAVRDVLANRLPVADAGADQFVSERANVTLNGAGSADPDGSVIGFSWSQVFGAEAELTATNTRNLQFVAPDVAEDETLRFQLKVTDNQGATDVDWVDIRVRNLGDIPNAPPAARIAADQSVIEGAQVTLDGRASSDPDGDPLSYLWSQADNNPAVTLINATAAQASFQAPQINAPTAYSFRLRVQDPSGAFSTAITRIDVQDSVQNTNAVPVVTITTKPADDTVASGESGTFVAEATDGDGDSLTISWGDGDNCSGSFEPADQLTTVYTAPEVTEDTTCVIVVTANDGNGGVDTDSADLSVTSSSDDNVETCVEDGVPTEFCSIIDAFDCLDPTEPAACYESFCADVGQFEPICAFSGAPATEPDGQDPDGDGVVGADDTCPDTAEGATVDADGCSDEQKQSEAEAAIAALADLISANCLPSENSDADQFQACVEDSVQALCVGPFVEAPYCVVTEPEGQDPDGDGVVGADDTCPDTAEGATVDADGCSDEQKANADPEAILTGLVSDICQPAFLPDQGEFEACVLATAQALCVEPLNDAPYCANAELDVPVMTANNDITSRMVRNSVVADEERWEWDRTSVGGTVGLTVITYPGAPSPAPLTVLPENLEITFGYEVACAGAVFHPRVEVLWNGYYGEAGTQADEPPQQADVEAAGHTKTANGSFSYQNAREFEPDNNAMAPDDAAFLSAIRIIIDSTAACTSLAIINPRVSIINDVETIVVYPADDLNDLVEVIASLDSLFPTGP